MKLKIKNNHSYSLKSGNLGPIAFSLVLRDFYG